MLDAKAAPLMPHFGMKMIFKTTFITKQVREEYMANWGFPLPDKSAANTPPMQNATVPGNKIIKGATDGKKTLPKRIVIKGIETIANKKEITIIIKKMWRTTLEVSSSATDFSEEQTFGNNTVANAPGIINNFSDIATAML